MMTTPRFLLFVLSFVFTLPAAFAAPRPFTVLALGNPRSITVDPAGNLYVGDVDNAKVYKLTPAGTVTTLGVGGPAIYDPIGMTVAPDGALIVADADANLIYRISPADMVSELGKTLANPASLATPTGVAVDTSGNLYVSNNGSSSILKLSPDGSSATILAGQPGATGTADGPGTDARFAAPRGIAIDPAGNLYVADENNSNIRKITSTGVVSTLAGGSSQRGSTDGSGADARFAAPRSLTVDPAGNVYVADTDNHTIRKITPAGIVSTLAGSAGQVGRADGTGAEARFSEPRGIAVDAEGIVYVADTGNGAVRQITPGGVVTTLAAAKP